MDTLKISNTGEKHIAITDDNGNQKGEIVFNPSDVIFAEKFYQFCAELNQAQKDFQERGKQIEQNTALDDVGIPINAGEWLNYLKDINGLFRSKIDILFGAGTSQMMYGDYLSYDMENYFQFFEGITPFIKTARAEKVAQYTTPASAKRNKRKAAGLKVG